MSRTPRADFWFSLVLIVLGAAALIESWRMPRLAELGIDPVSAPGITPGLLAAIITGLGLTLLLRAVRATPEAAEAGDAGWHRLALSVALCLLYALGLLGRVDFPIATALFVFAFAYLFSEGPAGGIRRLANAALLAIATAAAVTFLFERLFLVRLP